jgi:hypothetical protein
MPGKKVYGIGDAERFRKVLRATGFMFTPWRYEATVWSNTRKTFRMVKLYNGLGVLEAPQEAQYKLDAALRKEFGDRYLCGYFLDSMHYQTSFCIRLTKEM